MNGHLRTAITGVIVVLILALVFYGTPWIFFGMLRNGAAAWRYICGTGRC